MSAHDTLYPDNIGSCSVLITVARNPSSPEFTSEDLRVTIDEQIPLGDDVVMVNATDVDNVSKGCLKLLMSDVTVTVTLTVDICEICSKIFTL